MRVSLIGGGNVYALNLARHLHSLGIDHFGIGRSPRKPDAFWVEHDYRYYQKHLLSDLSGALNVLDSERPDTIIQFAAQGEGAASFATPDLFYATNTYGLVRFAEELRKRDYVKRFTQISTSELYGSTEHPAKETDPLRSTSPYAVSKAAFDQHLEIMHRVYGFPMNIVRPSNAYCVGQQLHRIIPRSIVCALSGQKLPLQGGGKAVKSYIHATDLSRGIMAILDKGRLGEVYNCGPDKPISIRDLVKWCAFACKVSFDDLVEIAPDRISQDQKYYFDSSKIRSLGWKPKINLADGVDEMVDWVRKFPELLTMDATYRIAA
jgi:dTDP-glucose 4,6-dehydratase